MPDNDIKEFDPASGEYKDLPITKEKPYMGNASAPKGKETPVGAGLQYNADNNSTPEVTPLQQAENQAEINAIVNAQNQADSEEYNKVPAKPAEKPVENYPSMRYGDVRKDVRNYLGSPLSYNGPYAGLYNQFGDLNGWTTQLDSLDSTSSNERELLEDPVAHLKGALKLAKEFGIKPDEALHNLTAVAASANDENPQAGIDYFLTTGIVKNKAAAKYANDIEKARTLLDSGKINEDQYKEALDNIAKEIASSGKYFDRPSNVKAITDSIFELGGYAGGVLTANFLGKALSKLPNSKFAKWFANTRVGKFFVDKGANAELDRLYNSLSKEVPISQADAKIIQACTPEDEAAFIRAYEEFKKIRPNGGDNEFLNYIKSLPSKTQKSITKTIKAADTFAKVHPEGFAFEMLDAYLDPNVTPEAAMNRYNFLVSSLKNRAKFNAAELARFLNINSKEQAGGIAGLASAYFNNLKPDAYTTSDNVTGGKGAEGTEPMPSRETAPINPNKVDEVSNVRTSKYLLNSPEVEEAYNKVKEAEKAFNDAPAEDKAVAKKALDEAVNDYNNKLNAAENDLIKEMPNKLRAMDNSQVNMRQFWKSSLGRSILDAYASGEISGGQALYFSIQALAEGILNASRGIATGIHGEGLQDIKPSTWDTLQKTRTSEAYSFRNQQLNQMANDQLNYVSEILKLDADSQKKVRDLMSDAITRNYYNKLDDSRKLEFIELLAAYAPKYVRFNDDQKKVFRQIMMESGQITPDDINLMISQFGMSGIAGLIRQGKESMMRSEYWKSESNRKEVERLEKEIDILESEGKIKNQEAEMYKLKLYTEASRGGIDVLKELLNLARK